MVLAVGNYIFCHYRYWGKIFGLKRNYYVLECEWRNEELQLRLRVRNVNEKFVPYN